MYEQQQGTTEPLGQIVYPPKTQEQALKDQFSQVVVLAMADTGELRSKATTLQIFNKTKQEVQDRERAMVLIDRAMSLIIEAERLINPGQSLLEETSLHEAHNS